MLTALVSAVLGFNVANDSVQFPKFSQSTHRRLFFFFFLTSVLTAAEHVKCCADINGHS